MKIGATLKAGVIISALMLFAACQSDEPVTPNIDPDKEQNQEEEEEEYHGASYITLNDEVIYLDINNSKEYELISLSVDAPNRLDVVVSSGYTFNFEGVDYKNGEDYSFDVDKIDQREQLSLVITKNSDKSRVESYINTCPAELDLGGVVSNNPAPGFYYTNYGDYICKLNERGEIIYYRKASTPSMFDCRLFDGKLYYSYLTKVESAEYPKIVGVGSYRCNAIIMDENYEQIDCIEAILPHESLPNIEGHPLDNHQFEMLGVGHYLVTAYVEEMVYNIPQLIETDEPKGVMVVAAVMQEIKDGELLFSWKSTDHPELYGYNRTTTYDPEATKTNDYLHLNSVVIDPSDNNYILSMRSCSTLLKLNRESGEVMWVLGGAADMFNCDKEQIFVGQHDISFCDDGSFTIFNNNCFSTTIAGNSSVMKFRLDEENLEIVESESYDLGYVTAAKGSAQELSAGHYLVGCGSAIDGGYLFTEIDLRSGEILFGIKSSKKTNYKAFKRSR